MSVDDEPCEVLQRGKALRLVHSRPQLQYQGRLLKSIVAGLGGGLVLHPPLLCCPLCSHVVLHQTGHAGEGGEAGPSLGAGIQLELGSTVLDPYAGGSASSPDRQGQHVQRVAAVPYQKGSLRRVLKRSVGLSRRYCSPVPSCTDNHIPECQVNVSAKRNHGKQNTASKFLPEFSR